MKLFVGLGNPGRTYSNNRHNIGFLVIDEIINHFSKNKQFKWINKHESKYCFLVLGDTKVLFAKPQTYMNLSGNSVKSLSKYFKISNEDIIIFHDELDLPLGKVKLKFQGGHSGHNGVKSIHNSIGSDYYRIRIGIGHPGEKKLVSNFVLSNFEDEEKDILESQIKNLSENIKYLIENKFEDFKSLY